MRGFYIIIGVCALFFGTPVTGVSFTSTPDRFVIGDSGTIIMSCSMTESDVSRVYNIKIMRAVAPGSTTDEVIAEFETDTATLNDQITNDKGFETTGSLNGASSRLELSMDRSKLRCNDARVYKCEVLFETTSGSTAQKVVYNVTLQAFVLPQMLPPLQAKRNGNYVEGGTQSDKAIFDVGDQLELQCKANIGSIDSATVRWRKTSETQDSMFNDYHPPEGTYDEGTPLSDNQCGYTRTATIRYNITAAVVGYDPGFECYVSVSGYPSSTFTPLGEYTTANNLQYHIVVTSSGTPKPSVSSAGSGNAGAIAGGVVGGLVFIVLIVLLVYFLWYRRRSSGEDYTTKEEYGSENPNMAPPVDSYASVDKKKRGHENRGLDEPHESRRHHYQNGPGKSNYGMDRDADDYDSRDGSPTMTHQGISHMGMDPMDGRIGTGV